MSLPNERKAEFREWYCATFNYRLQDMTDDYMLDTTAYKAWVEATRRASVPAADSTADLSAAQIAAGAKVLGDDGKPVGRNVAIMVADAMRAAASSTGGRD